MMTYYWKKLITIVVCITILFVWIPDAAEAQMGMTYFGEMSWRVQQEGGAQGNSILQVGLVYYGAGHIMLNGKITHFDEGGDIWYQIVHGNAEILGNSMVMGLTLIEMDPFVVASFMYATINLTSFSGTYQRQSLEDTGPEWGNGTLTFYAWQ